MKKIYLLLAFCCSLFYLQAQDGRLDRSFGNNGLTSLNLPKGNFGQETGIQVLPQADGGVIVALEINFHTGLMRYLPNGALDRNFGKDGYLQFVNLRPEAAILQKDGKIVVAGYAYNDRKLYYDFGLVRYNRNGTLDYSFGYHGKTTTDFGNSSHAYALALDRNGRIVVSGSFFNGQGGTDFAIACYDQKGRLDKKFGNGGKFTNNFGYNYFSTYTRAVAIQTDGKIVAGGQVSTNASSSDFALVRLNRNGSIDNSFGEAGLQVMDIGGSDWVQAIAIQKDGKIILAGNTGVGYLSFALARFNSNGTPDNGFDGDGKLVTSVSSADNLEGLALQPDGKILVGGAALIGGRSGFALVRYLPNGSLDYSFGTYGGGGKTLTDFGISANANAIALQPNGKILAAGVLNNEAPAYSDLALARYNNNGTLDDNFDDDGMLTASYPIPSSFFFQAMVLQPDGKVLTAGQLRNEATGKNDFIAARFDIYGSPDEGFGNSGKTTTDFGGDDPAYCMALQKNGKIIIGGSTNSSGFGSSDVALARYNQDGSLDNSFGTGGKIIATLNHDNGAWKIVTQNDGKIVVAVTGSSENGNSDFILLRYNSDGTPDEDFGNSGKVVTDFGNYDFASALAIQEDGKILVAGEARLSSVSATHIALARYNSDGSPDLSFGNNGKLISEFGYSSTAYSVALQPNGKIIVGGQTYNFYHSPSGNYFCDFLLVRYNSDGSLDNSFGEGGKKTTDFGALDNPRGMSVQDDGKIILSGHVEYGIESSDVALARYSEDGKIDRSFGHDGKLVTDFGIFDYVFASVWKNDRLYITGDVYSASGQQGVVISYVAKSEYKKYRPEYVSRNGATVANDKTNKMNERDLLSNQKLSVAVLPNPTVAYFTLRLQGGKNSIISITVTDNLGRVVERKSAIAVNSTIQLGHNYMPGIYYAEVVQGTERLVLKLQKIKN
jgi:uncharacterized delta-60 repeat protein